MEMQGIGMLAGLALGGLGLFFLAWRIALRQRRAAAKAHASAPDAASPMSQPVPQPAPVSQPAAPSVPGAAGPDPLLRRLERRMEEIEAAQAGFAERLAGIAEDGSAARLQAMAGSLVTLVRDKNAAMETALAGLDGLRARLATLEGVGELAEARALFEGLKTRIETVESAQAGAAAAREAEARAAEARAAEIRGLEARLAALGAGWEAREEGRRAAEAAEGKGALAEVAETLARLHAGKEAAVETVFSRLGPLEARLAGIEAQVEGLDPEAALERFGARLEAVRAELAARVAAAGAEAGAAAAAQAAEQGAVAEIAGALARLHEQKDATAEAVLARLGPLEEQLAALALRVSGLDPQAAFDRFGERLDAARAALQVQIDALKAEAADAHPLADLAEALTRLHAGKNAAVEAVLGRLAPVSARLAGLERALAEAEARGLDEAEDRAAAQAIAAQLIATRTVAEETRLFADRLSLLEASLPRLSLSQSLMMQALERHSVHWNADPAALPSAPPPSVPAEGGEGGDLPEVWRNPRVVSLHHSGS